MKIRFVLPALAAAAALALTGCVNDEGTGGSSGAAEGLQVDEAAVALLPEEIRESGVLTLGTDADYPPNEYQDANGNPAGWGIELAEAVAAKFGLTPEWEILSFDSILPRIEEDALNMGASSFTDNLERQKTVDFVNYLNAGSQWAAAVGADVDPENACGLTVAVQAGTIQATDELPARNAKCADEGKDPIEVLEFPGQPQVTQAVADGRADAFSADLPVTGDAVIQLEGQIEVVGEVFDAAPYGFAVKKDSGMAEAVQAALQSLIDDGTYEEIMAAAGLEGGMVSSATINAGTE
jgi:polar amino acid transport system substrate-binding protein